MKKIFCFIVFAGALYYTQAQSVSINTDGSQPHPSAMLDIKSNIKGLLIPRTSTSTRNTISGIKGLMMYDTTTSSFWYHNGAAWLELGGGSATNYWSANGTNIYNNNNGNVGIGTSTPGYDLHISRTNPSIGFNDTDDNHFSGFIEGDSNDLVLNAYRKAVGLSNQSGNIIMQVPGGGPLGFTSVAGNVGIGTSSPTAKLHISSGNVMIGNGTPDAKLHVLGTTGEVFRVEATNPQIGFAEGGIEKGFINLTSDDFKIGTISSNDAGRFIVRVNGGDRFFVHPDGRISIGTATPATGYALSVKGKAICEELKIQLQSAPWPDYVFNKNYPLKSFSELRKFIAQNNHLPNIPSAKQIESAGLEIGNMQTRMMEKIEELTLYILQLEEKSSKLEKEISTLKKQINK